MLPGMHCSCWKAAPGGWRRSICGGVTLSSMEKIGGGGGGDGRLTPGCALLQGAEYTEDFLWVGVNVVGLCSYCVQCVVGTVRGRRFCRQQCWLVTFTRTPAGVCKAHTHVCGFGGWGRGNSKQQAASDALAAPCCLLPASHRRFICVFVFVHRHQGVFSGAWR